MGNSRFEAACLKLGNVPPFSYFNEIGSEEILIFVGHLLSINTYNDFERLFTEFKAKAEEQLLIRVDRSAVQGTLGSVKRSNSLRRDLTILEESSLPFDEQSWTLYLEELLEIVASLLSQTPAHSQFSFELSQDLDDCFVDLARVFPELTQSDGDWGST